MRAEAIKKNRNTRHSMVIQLRQPWILSAGIMLHCVSLHSYCVPVMVMSKLKVVMPVMLDETARLSTAWTDAPTAST